MYKACFISIIIVIMKKRIYTLERISTNKQHHMKQKITNTTKLEIFFSEFV